MKKHIPRVVALAITLIMLVNMLPLSVFAIENMEETETMVLSVSSVSGMPGKTVQVTIKLENNPGLALLKFDVVYDNVLTLTDVSLNSTFGSYITAPEPYTNPQTITLISPLNDVSAEGILATLTFDISEEALDYYTANINITYDAADVYNGDYDNIALTVVNGSVTVYHGVPGDIDGDSKVNTKDAILLFRYVAGWDVDVDTAAIDVNGDNSVNTKDAITLFRYVAGWDGISIGRGEVCVHELTFTDAKSATCTEDGNNSYWQCTLCNEYYGDENGASEIFLKDIVLNANGHTEVVDEAVAPTYNNTGLTEGIHCSICASVIIEQEIVPQLEPNYYSITFNNLNGADPSLFPTTYTEHEGISFDNMPVPVVEGYSFEGWYKTTTYKDEDKVDYVPIGSTKNYILFAKWKLKEYTITYKNAPECSNPTKYTVEGALVDGEIVEGNINLKEAGWGGLVFSHWTDESGNACTNILKGTTGNRTITANWKYRENIAISTNNQIEPLTVYDENTSNYYFIYKLGDIDNVVLGDIEAYDKAGNLPITYTYTEKFGVEESIANTVGQTVGQNVSKTNEWSQTSEWVKNHSESTNWNLSVGAEIPIKIIKAKIQASEGGSTTDESSWSNSTFNGTSDNVGSELGHSYSSTVSYANNVEKSYTIEVSIPADSPDGRYRYVFVGTVKVYAIVTYNADTQDYHVDTYSILDDEYRYTFLYELLSSQEQTVNIVDNAPLAFAVDIQALETRINSSWHKVYYESNGGEGTMPVSVFYENIAQPLHPNQFSKEGYIFAGWNIQGDTNFTRYQDQQVVNDLASAGETITLVAQWTPNSYKIIFDVAGGASLSQNEKMVTFDSNYGELPEATRTGYTFSGWYYGNNLVTRDTIVKVPQDHTLKAKWTPTTYAVIFNATGGTVAPSTKQVEYASTYGELPTPTREGYIFNGWYTHSSGGTQVLSDSATISTGEPMPTTLYAHWTPITYYIFIDIYDMNRVVEVKYDESYTLSWNGDWANSFSNSIKFDGWYYSGEGNEINDGLRCNKTTLLTNGSDYTIRNWTTIDGAYVFFYGETYYDSDDGSCFTGDTLVTLADGSSTTLESLKVGDIVMSWNAITGEFEAMPISLFWNHGEDVYDIISLTFSNGKTLKVVTEHGFFDATLNKYVYIDASNYSNYIGHEFACLNENGVFENVILIEANYKKEVSSCYSLRTACNDNAIVDGFLTLTHEDIPGFLTYFEFGDGYMYDEVKMQKDIEKYGLYTYDDWKEYVSYEEFVALNGQYLTIVIGKGYLTYEDVLTLIEGMR